MEKNDNLIPEFDDFEVIVNMAETDDSVEETEVDETAEEEVQVETSVVETTEEIEVEEETEESIEAAKAVFTTLVHKGIIPDDKDFDGSWTKLEESLTSLPDRIAEDIIDSAPDITKKVLEFAFAAGETITKDALKNFVNTYLEDIDNSEKDVDVTTVEGARAFMKEQLSKSLKPVAVEAALDAMEDDESLVTEAKAKLEDVKKTNNHQKLIDDKNTENVQAAERVKQKTLAIQKELVTDNYSKEAIQVITNYLSDKNNKVNTILKQALDEPKALVQLVHFLTKFDDKTKQFNFEGFVKEAATPAVLTAKKNILKDSFSSLPKTTIKKEVSLNKKYDSIEPIVEYTN